MATGVVSVVYWVPGPPSRPNPPSSRMRRSLGPANEPCAGLRSNLPLILAMSTGLRRYVHTGGFCPAAQRNTLMTEKYAVPALMPAVLSGYGSPHLASRDPLGPYTPAATPQFRMEVVDG